MPSRIEAQVLFEALAQREIRMIPDGDGLIVEPASLLTDADCDAIREHKTALLRYLAAGPARPPQSPPDETTNEEVLEVSCDFNPADQPNPDLVTVRWRDGVLISDSSATSSFESREEAEID